MCEHCKEIIEIYAGMEGFIPETAPEAYQQTIIKRMYDEAVKSLHENETQEKFKELLFVKWHEKITIAIAVKWYELKSFFIKTS